MSVAATAKHSEMLARLPSNWGRERGWLSSRICTKQRPVAFVHACPIYGVFNRPHLDDRESFVRLWQAGRWWRAAKEEEPEHSETEEWQGQKRRGLIDGEVVSEDSQTDSDSQTFFSIVDSQCLYICEKQKQWTEGWEPVLTLQPAKDTILAAITEL